MARAMAVIVGQLSVSEEAKERYDALLPNNPNMSWVLTLSTASAATALISLPFDNVKTKMQKMRVGIDGKMPYTGIFDCLRKEVRMNGITGPWVGLPTYAFRFTPQTIIVLTVAEQLKKWML